MTSIKWRKHLLPLYGLILGNRAVVTCYQSQFLESWLRFAIKSFNYQLGIVFMALFCNEMETYIWKNEWHISHSPNLLLNNINMRQMKIAKVVARVSTLNAIKCEHTYMLSIAVCCSVLVIKSFFKFLASWLILTHA